MSTPPLLQVQHLHKAFGGNQAVRDVSFELHAGEMLALIGPNGAGKSTTFNLVNGQLQPDRGRITLAGTSLLGLAPHALWRMGVSRTFQVAQTLSSFTVIENVQMALLSAHGLSRAPLSRATHYQRGEAMQLLAQVQLETQAQRPCRALAYGDVKRLELAMALANTPRLLLMDEPTAGMAVAERRALMQLTHQIARARSVGVLFTEHSMDVVFEHASRVLVMAQGALMAQGSPAQVRDNPDVQAVYFGGGKSFAASLGAGAEPNTLSHAKGPTASEPSTAASQGHARASTPPTALVSLPTPSVLASQDLHGSHARTTQTPPLLRVEQLSAWYGAAQVVFDAALEVGHGEVVALVGPNGAGKSSLLKAIMGLMPRRTGRVHFDGQDLSQVAPFEAARAGLGYVPEDRRIFTELTVLENLQLGVQTTRPRTSPSAPKQHTPPHAPPYAPPYAPDSVRGRHRPAWSLAQVFALFPNLAHMQQRLAHHMSGGEQQMLTVARTLMGNPRLVLLDEPSEGVAPVIVEQMAEMVLALKRQGVSVLLSEQNLQFANWVSDRHYTLDRGVVKP